MRHSVPAVPVSRRQLLLAGLASPFVALADEAILGGPCEGCDWVFRGMPGSLTANARIAPAEQPGEPLTITGTVFAADGRPAPGIVVYAYQTDAGGIYPRAETRHGSLRGWVLSDAEGHYRFDTIRPGSYPGRNVPQHVHMHVVEPGVGTYYIDDIMFTDDPLLTKKQIRQAQRGRGGQGIAEPRQGDDGVWQVTRDIRLGENIRDYPVSG